MRQPTLAIVVRVREVFLHCAKAFRSKIILDQTTGAPEDEAAQRKLDEDLEVEYRKTLY